MERDKDDIRGILKVHLHIMNSRGRCQWARQGKDTSKALLNTNMYIDVAAQ